MPLGHYDTRLVPEGAIDEPHSPNFLLPPSKDELAMEGARRRTVGVEEALAMARSHHAAYFEVNLSTQRNLLDPLLFALRRTHLHAGTETETL